MFPFSDHSEKATSSLLSSPLQFRRPPLLRMDIVSHGPIPETRIGEALKLPAPIRGCLVSKYFFEILRQTRGDSLGTKLTDLQLKTRRKLNHETSLSYGRLIVGSQGEPKVSELGLQ